MVQENISQIKGRISLICSQINRDPESVTIVAVSKGRTAQQIKEAVESGLTDIGENRIQEALSKYNEIRTTNEKRRIKWHLVGHLQTNKVKDAVKIFDLIHSVDSLRLAQAIDKEAAKINKAQDILVEIKTSPEESKAGLKPEEAMEVIKDVATLKNIRMRGLMTIAPLVDNIQETRPYFKLLRELRDKINGLRITDYELRILSMGMTDDFEIAIEEGSDMVRLGRAVFEG